MSSAYAALTRLFDRLSALDDAMAVLSWDQSVMMPEGGAAARGRAQAGLKTLAHEILTGAQVKPLLDAAANEDLEGWQQANLREMRRDWSHAAALPGSLVESLSKACTACETVWRKAKPASDFAAVAPLLEEVVRLTRQAAEIKSQVLGVSPYDALLDAFEPGGRIADITAIFDDLAGFLPGFLAEVQAKQSAPPAPLPGPFPVAQQKELGLAMMTALGFDFTHGRLDVSSHPFCGGTPDDVRITTRYDEAAFLRSLLGVIHETGHALYERGLPENWRGQPVGRARGMSIHESQSLLMEMQFCRSPEFFRWAAPHMVAAFGRDGQPGWDADSLYRAHVRAEPGFIRVDADEVTYPAHIILRTRLEQAMIAGELEVRALPGVWNDGMESLLGLRPENDRLGCLQDIHWYDGLIGYFPTYTLGAMTAAQLFATIRTVIPDVMDQIAAGNFIPLRGWLAANIHDQGCLLNVPDLLTQATGRPLSAEPFKAHLRRRYLPG